ncbi:hypothetical protein [Curvibacter lanceolatus]|uniref:hypothetical protein n=1 Tax=Curvibacter lanceolatus TaxID=86182 RepID=UPI0004CF77FD|nr:hypothetical protein [Curvibacter lanceolatus]
MARIRTIKPEFFTSEDICSLTPLARLLYVALWCEADRAGRFEWKPRTFKLRYLPGDNCDVETLASELVNAGLVILYEADGKNLAEIPTFDKHQVINNRESESQFPSRVANASTTRQARVKAEGRKEGKGKDARVASLSDTTQDPDEPLASLVDIPLVDKTDYEVTQSAVDEWQESFPAVDVLQQVKAMRAWCHANPTNRKTRAGIERFIVRWLAKAQNQAPRSGASGGGSSDGAGSYV